MLAALILINVVFFHLQAAEAGAKDAEVKCKLLMNCLRDICMHVLDN